MLSRLVNLVENARKESKAYAEKFALDRLHALLNGRVGEKILTDSLENKAKFEREFWAQTKFLNDKCRDLQNEMADMDDPIRMSELFQEVCSVAAYRALKQKHPIDQSTFQGQAPIAPEITNTIYSSLTTGQLAKAVATPDAYKKVNATLLTLRQISQRYEKIALADAKLHNNFDYADKLLQAKDFLHKLVPVSADQDAKKLVQEIRELMFTLYEVNTFPVLPAFNDKTAQKLDREIITAMSLSDPEKSFAKDKMKLEIQAYINLREAEFNKSNKLYNTFFGRIFGQSKIVKINAAKNMIKALDGKEVTFSAEDCLALRDSRLNKIVSKYEGLGALPQTYLYQEQQHTNRYALIKSHQYR